MEMIFETLQDTFERSALSDLRGYLVEVAHYGKFFLISDYCLHAKNNDVFSFTIMPYDDTLEDIKQAIRDGSKRDLKHKSDVEESFITYLKDRRLFHINFVINESRGITRRSDKTEREVVEEMMDNTIKMLDAWVINTPSNAPYFVQIKNKTLSLQNKLSRKSANYKLMRDSMLTAVLAGYISYLLIRECRPEVIGWFPDRDKMHDDLYTIRYDWLGLNAHALCEKSGITSTSTKICAGVPDMNGGNSMWYDDLIRIPDHFAGTLADLDLVTCIPSSKSPKFNTMLNKVLADNRFVVTIKSTFAEDGYRASRLVFNKY